ncbi:MAG: PLP-dependent lyase/thiolase [Nanoarchaeota archaeon]
MALSRNEEAILKSIKVASENDPANPEFPPENPKFPATPTYRIKVPGFTDVWLKDESVNPTGTHKDRMAWEIIVTYRDFLIAKKRGQLQGGLPSMSIISSGSAAVAIQSYLRQYGLPNLKVIVDSSIQSFVLNYLKKIGCEIYKADLSKKALNWEDILNITHNPNGFDITSSEALDSTTRFYDWLSYEIINSSPDYVFVPFGTGNLYENILNIVKKEVSTIHHDPRFKGDVGRLRNCNFLGATTNNSKSKAAEKLYSPHLPFVHYDEQWIRFYRYAGYCGPKSNVHLIKDSFLDEAIELASSQKIVCEPSGIAGLALMLQLKLQLPKDKKMLIVNTGKTKYL